MEKKTLEKIKNLKWKWVGHVCRILFYRWARIFAEWVPRYEQKNKGRPKKRREDIIREKSGPDWRGQA